MTANPLSPSSHNHGPGSPRPSAPPQGAGRFTPLDPLRTLRQYARLLIVTAIVGLVAGLGLWAALRKYSPRYSSTAQLLVQPPASVDPVNVGMGSGQMDVLAIMIQNKIVAIKNEEVFAEVLRREPVRQTNWFRGFQDVEEARKDLQENLSVTQLRGTTLIALTFSGRYRNDLRTILDSVIDVHLFNESQLVNNEESKRRQAYVKEREDAQDALNRIQKDLARFREVEDLTSLRVNENKASVAYNDLTRQSVALDTQLRTAQETYAALQAASQSGKILPTPDDMAEVRTDPAVNSREERLRALNEQRSVLLATGLMPEHRQIRYIDETIIATESEKQREVERALRDRQEVKLELARKAVEGTQAQILALAPELDQANDVYKALNLKLEEYARLEAQQKTQQERLREAQANLDLMQRARDLNSGGTVRRYLAPTSAELTAPKLPAIVVGVMFGLLALVTGLVFLKELLDQRIKTPADIHLLPHAPLLGMLPDTAEDPLGPPRIEGAVRADPTGLIAESFRQVRTAMLTHIDRRGHRAIMIVGAQPASGVSAVTGNLAISLAYSGRRVLVIDANLRRPSQHRTFQTDLRPGLVEVVAGAAGVQDAIVNKEEEGIDILPAGDYHRAPPEMLESPAFRNLLAQLESRYDLILIDAPPALLTSESQLLARHVDAVAVVVRAMQERRGAVARMLRMFEGQRAEMLGIVVNGVRSSAGGYFRKNYEEFYKYRQPGGSRSTSSQERQSNAAAPEPAPAPARGEVVPE